MVDRSVNSEATIRVQNYPFPFLLHLEWGLLLFALMMELLPTPKTYLFGRPPIITIVTIIGFGLMGLRLPTQQLFSKVAYIGLAFSLILLASLAEIRGMRLFPFLYVILVIRSCLMFQLAGRTIITVLAFAMFALAMTYRLHNLDSRGLLTERTRILLSGFALNSVLLFGLVLLFVLLLINALLAERQSREKLAEANRQLRRYTLQVENLAMAQERSRIAREIHDSLGHSLTALNLQIEGALKLSQTNPAQAQAFLQQAKRLGSTALQDVRQSVAAMRSDPLQGKSLPEAIAPLLHDFEQATGIQPQTQIHLTVPLSANLSMTLYRIVQEALTNICKHAHATQVRLELRTTASDVLLTIQDNGKGFQPEQNQSGFGLQGMQERAQALDGQLQIESAIDRGCRIMAHFKR